MTLVAWYYCVTEKLGVHIETLRWIESGRFKHKTMVSKYYQK